MRRLSPLRTFLVLAAVAAGTASCGDSAGTYVRLTFQGTVSAQAPIQRILIDLQLGDRPATTEFTAPDKGDITLPKTAVLEIGSGDGAIAITARALSQTGILLGTGQGQGTVVRGQTTPITITFGAAFGDAGVDGPIGIDGPPSRIDAGIDTAGWDGPVDRPLDSEPALDGAVLDVAGSVETGIDLAGRDVAVDAPAQGGVSGTGGLGGGGTGGRGGAGGSGGSTGTGGNPGAYRLIVDPPSMDFGVLVPGTTSPPQTITITNAGDLASPPLVTWISDQTVFPVKLDTCTGIALSPGGTCTASFAFSPGGQGDFRADGSVAPATETGAKFQLSGTGAGGPATLSLSPSNLNLGMVDVGAAVPTTFTLTNGGDTGAGTIGIQLAGPAAFQIGANTCTNTQLGPRSQCTFVVTFAPTTFGPVSATVTAQSSLGLTANASLTATARDFVNLTIAFQGTGAGEVTGGPQNCPSGAPCSFAVPRTDPTNLPQFVLTAQPNELSVFKIWGGACSGSGPCTVVMSGDRSVVADFEPRMVTINLTVLGLAGHVGVISSEDGIIECSGSCPNLQHPATTELILLAKPISSGGTFAAWTSGPCRGTEPKCTIPLLDPVSITATFGPRSYMFVTSTTLVPGMLGGVAAADEECKNLAGEANLPGSYAAWLSTSTMNANTRIGNGGWIRVDGRPFGRDIDALANPTAPVVYYPPRVDEKGNDLGNVHIPVATGSKPEGVGAGSYCKDYADPNGSLYVGEASSGAFAWGGGTLANSGCGLPHRLYCFRKDLSPGPITPPPQDGRRVFVTTKPYVIADGSTPDEWCMKDAEAYRLPNPDKFSAFVATTTMPAINRVRLDGPPWKRLDEVFLTQQPDDLPGGKLLAPIDLASDAKTYTNFMVWSGAKSPTDLGESGTCGNWSPYSPSQPGMVGDGRTSAFPDWFQVSTLTCSSTSTHLMCFER